MTNKDLFTTELYNFLRKKRVILKAARNIKSLGGSWKQETPYESIGMMFIWMKTSEGYDFWRDLDNEFTFLEYDN